VSPKPAKCGENSNVLNAVSSKGLLGFAERAQARFICASKIKKIVALRLGTLGRATHHQQVLCEKAWQVCKLPQL